MWRRSVVLIVAGGLASSACSGSEVFIEAHSERIEFESVDLPGRLWDPFMPSIEDGRPVIVSASLAVPSADSPVPVVIITHGCGGIGGAERGWVDDLGAAGVATLVIDSFGPRGIGEICTGRETINVLSPVVDIYRAAKALDGHPDVDGSRIAVMGFSFGGRAAIWSGFTRFQEAYDGRGFSAHIAFYPSTCFIRLTDEEMGGVPLRLFHGTDDNWTPLDQCEEMVERLIAGGTDAAIYAYDGAGHSFDDPALAWSSNHLSLQGLSPRRCSFVEIDGAIIDPGTGGVAGVASTCVERGVSYGYDAAARAQAATDLMDVLDAIFRR